MGHCQLCTTTVGRVPQEQGERRADDQAMTDRGADTIPSQPPVGRL